MIPIEKDRLECLRLAVSLVIPRHTVTADKVADLVVQTAERFHKFVSDDGARK